VTKIAEIKMSEAFRRQYKFNGISVLLAKLLSPGNKFDCRILHVIPDPTRKLYEAKRALVPAVTVCGTGKPWHEFPYVDDLADANVWTVENYVSDWPLNIATGDDNSISDLAKLFHRRWTTSSGKVVSLTYNFHKCYEYND
jgi:GDP-L-fucose synthase